MARKRMVHAELFTSETVASLPIRARYTWVGVITYLDDAGRGKDNASLVKAAVWPLDDEVSSADVRADLDALLDAGMLCSYECCGSAQVHAPAWLEFQKISHATPSRQCPCPHCEVAEADAHETLSHSGVAPEKFRSRSGKAPRSVVEVRSVESSSGDVVPIPRDFRERVEAAKNAVSA